MPPWASRCWARTRRPQPRRRPMARSRAPPARRRPSTERRRTCRTRRPRRPPTDNASRRAGPRGDAPGRAQVRRPEEAVAGEPGRRSPQASTRNCCRSACAPDSGWNSAGTCSSQGSKTERLGARHQPDPHTRAQSTLPALRAGRNLKLARRHFPWRCRSAVSARRSVDHWPPTHRGADRSPGSRDCRTGSRGRSSCIASSVRMEPRGRRPRQGLRDGIARVSAVEPDTHTRASGSSYTTLKPSSGSCRSSAAKLSSRAAVGTSAASTS